MDTKDAEARIAWALTNWQLVAAGEVTTDEFRPEEAAYWLYRNMGWGRRFGLEPSGELAAILDDPKVQEVALQYLEADFCGYVFRFLTEDKDALHAAGESEFDLLIDRDGLDCAERELWKHIPPSTESPATDPFRRRLLSVSTNLARADSIMQACMDRFAPWAEDFEAMLSEFLAGTATEVNQWWFFDLPAFARGERTIEDFTYGCTDAVRFPEWVLADYIGGTTDAAARAALEAHMKVCTHCREVVEGAKDAPEPEGPGS
ncbi:hypothetical protein HY624_04335 [Candidatus Uhrbacteria bacterium]|nr:hypothetical protein [Candidatus Uhrbacteria bacterium]